MRRCSPATMDGWSRPLRPSDLPMQHPTAQSSTIAYHLHPYLSRQSRVSGMNTLGEKVMWRWAASRSSAAARMRRSSGSAWAAASASCKALFRC